VIFEIKRTKNQSVFSCYLCVCVYGIRGVRESKVMTSTNMQTNAECGVNVWYITTTPRAKKKQLTAT
jgi:hypothetical protein